MTQHDRQLDEWLADVAEADRQMAPPADLEARVMAGVQLETSRGLWTTRHIGRGAVWMGAGAALAAGVLFSLGLPRSGPEHTPVIRAVPAVAEAAATPVETSLPIVAEAVRPPEPPTRLETPRPGRRQPARPDTARHARRIAAEPEVLDFVPLVPLSEEELLGAFQIVRVQLSHGPGGPVQADVLLGQDGMARAIRVSTRR